MRLALTRRGDYAVRAAVALADAGEHRLSAATIADRMRIPPSFVTQVMADLSRAGVVNAVKGRAAVIGWPGSPHDISLLDAVQAAEPARQRTCVLRGSPCDVGGGCAVHDTFVRGEDAVLSVLRETTLRDIVENDGSQSESERMTLAVATFLAVLALAALVGIVVVIVLAVMVAWRRSGPRWDLAPCGWPSRSRSPPPRAASTSPRWPASSRAPCAGTSGLPCTRWR